MKTSDDQGSPAPAGTGTGTGESARAHPELPLSLADFEEARRRVAPHLHRTPLLSFRTLGAPLGAESWLKCENLQKTGSFKVRGGLNAIAALAEGEEGARGESEAEGIGRAGGGSNGGRGRTPKGRAAGVITISAGNHAQAVAWAAARAGIRSVVVMPEGAARTKVAAARGYGAEVILHGNAHEAFAEARRRAAAEGLVFLHPFDAPEVIAGHGSTGIEIVEDLPGPGAIVVPVGGGGQIAGIAGALAATGQLPARSGDGEARNRGGRKDRDDRGTSHPAPGRSWRIFGVEPAGASAMHRSLGAGRAVHLETTDTIADGLAAPMAGTLTYRYVERYVEDVAVVRDEEILAAMRLLMTRAGMVAEPSGAAAAAAIMAGRIPLRRGERVVAVVTGANADPAILARALTEGEAWP